MKDMGKIRSTKDKRNTCKKNPIKEIAKVDKELALNWGRGGEAKICIEEES